METHSNNKQNQNQRKVDFGSQLIRFKTELNYKFLQELNGKNISYLLDLTPFTGTPLIFVTIEDFLSPPIFTGTYRRPGCNKICT